MDLIKVPDRANVRVGESVSWTLRNFHNQRGIAVTDFAIIDLPGVGLYFASGSLPAFTHGVGVTYDIRFQVAGSNVWHTHQTNINANQAFSFTLPQPGNIRYTSIGFFFGNVPANFGLGNTIILTFTAGENAPNNTLTNRFIVTSGGQNREGEGATNLLRPPIGGNNSNITTGQIPQTGVSTTLWLAVALNLMAVGALTTLIIKKRNKTKRM